MNAEKVCFKAESWEKGLLAEEQIYKTEKCSVWFFPCGDTNTWRGRLGLSLAH